MTQRIAVISITRHGVATAGRIVAALSDATLYAPEKFAAEALAAQPSATLYGGKTSALLGELFRTCDAIVAVISLGAVVRMIAPLLQTKETDPAVIVVDEGARFIIPTLSGHLGGANALAGHLALALDATPVLTTASDSRQTIGVDLLGREFGWTLDAPHHVLVRASAAMVNDEPVALVQEAGERDWWSGHANGRSGPLPANVTLFDKLEDVAPEQFAAVLWIAAREMPNDYRIQLAGRCVTYRPPQIPNGGQR